MKKSHVNFQVTRCGLFINKQYIESMELFRSECQTRGLLPEHPRVLDDLERYFAVLRYLLEQSSTTRPLSKTAKRLYRILRRQTPICLSSTGLVSMRHFEGPMVSFNVPSAEGIERLDWVTISCRADPGVLLANTASVPQRVSLKVRAQFYSEPERLPPLVLYLIYL